MSAMWHKTTRNVPQNGEIGNIECAYVNVGLDGAPEDGDERLFADAHAGAHAQERRLFVHLYAWPAGMR